MKVTSVERVGSWRPSYADARPIAVSRLQSIAPVESADAASGQTITSERELPTLPVGQTDRAMARPVRPGDKPVPGSVNAGTATESNPVATVLAFKAVAEQAAATAPPTPVATPLPATEAAEPDTPARNARAAAPANQRPSLAELQRAADNPGNLTSLELATQASNQRLAEEARKAAAAPPAEPISKMLMDHVQSMWAASRKAVDAVAVMHNAGAAAVTKTTTRATGASASADGASDASAATGDTPVSPQKEA